MSWIEKPFRRFRVRERKRERERERGRDKERFVRHPRNCRGGSSSRRLTGRQQLCAKPSSELMSKRIDRFVHAASVAMRYIRQAAAYEIACTKSRKIVPRNLLHLVGHSTLEQSRRARSIPEAEIARTQFFL